jgi:signal transduction histidine kinase
MTFRLVGLMSLVLLLSLAAFALVMNSYQAEVMGEVTRTVSAVGRATLQTFEHHTLPSGVKIVTAPAPESGTAGAKIGFQYKVITHDLPDVALPNLADHLAIFRSNPHVPADVLQGTQAPGSNNKMVVVRVEEVSAESDAAGDTVLRIPTWRVQEYTKVDGKEPGTFTWVTDAPDPAKATGSEKAPSAGSAKLPETGNTLKSHRQEIVLPIPTREFHDLFAGFRERTLFLFLGIFALGTLLSAGLAARFTRPVRRLDAGIRRLAEGDLDVRVEAAGSDEVGRLGRAFNEMADRLRASKQREAEMRRREKLSALGRMAAGVAHDVRNPLHAIGLTLQNLQETARPAEPERGRDFDRSVAVIRDEIRRLDRLIENFLRFARSDRAAHVQVDLAHLARETAQLVEKEAQRRGVRVLVASDGPPVMVEGDREAIGSSILNLVLNSFQAMPHGGTLTLSARQVEGEARLEVADTGEGIPSQEQEKVFDFSYTTREEGHGLGLAMVHQVVVEDHGGRVSLSSSPGEGTQVLMAFPSRSQAAEAAS